MKAHLDRRNCNTMETTNLLVCPIRAIGPTKEDSP